MKHPVVWLSALIGLSGTMLAPVTRADPLYRTTEVTFHQPVEIPGMVLPAGTYVMRLLDPIMDRHIVRFDDAKEKHMYAMVFTVPDYRLQATDHTMITFEERAKDAPEAIKEWFPAGENWGEQFVYAKSHPLATPEAPAQLQPRPTSAVAPAPEPKPVAPAPVAKALPTEQQPVEIAQAQPARVPSQPVTPAPAAPEQKKELPKTASQLPIVALIGGVFVLAGAILRRRTA